jgi:hypothetical protein
LNIQAAEGGDLHITLHADSVGECGDRDSSVDQVDTPGTLSGQGRLVDATTLVVPSPVLTCDDGREPRLSAPSNYTLVIDAATGRLFDHLGNSWHRGAPPLEPGERATRKVGPGSYSFLGGDVTFQADEPWSDHAESYLDERLFFLVGEGDAQIYIIANPTPLPIDPCDADLLPASAAAVVDAVRSNPSLEVTVPVAERVGGLDAERMDVAPVLAAPPCDGAFPVVSSSRTWGVVAPGQMGRLSLLDLPGGSARALAILIVAPEAEFERVLQAAMPVVDSFEFHTG